MNTEFYAEPDEALTARRFVEYRTRFIEPLFPADKSIRIGDLGCGYGLFLAACRKAGYRNTEGVEQISSCVKYAERELGLDAVACADIFRYLESKPDAYFDVLTAFNVIEHVPKDRVLSLLCLIYAKLRSGGLFIMEVPNADSSLGLHTYFSDLTHEFAYSKKLALQLFALAGFKDVRASYQPNIRHLFVQLAQRALAKIIGLDYRAMFSGNIIVLGYR